MLLHGAGGVGQLWHHQLLAFPKAVAPDLPGHPAGEGLASVPAIAAWVDRFLEDRGRVVLGGHSLGSAVALQAALDAPRRLLGLILMGAGARLRVRQEFFEFIRRDSDEAVEELLRWWFAPGASPRIVARARAALRTVSPAVLEADLRAADGFDVMDRVREIAYPTLVICGEEDRLTPLKYSEYLRRAIPGARLVTVPQAGHMVMLEQPRAVNAAIADFLRTVESPCSST